MTLGENQECFARDLGLLLCFIISRGYNVRMGDVFAHDGHKAGSQHYKKLAADINLFLNGDYLTETSDHQEIGDYWEALDPHNRWGGRYEDGNHYERMEQLWAS